MHILCVCVAIVLTHEFEYLTIIHKWCDVKQSAQICKVCVVVIFTNFFDISVGHHPSTRVL